MPVIRHPPKTQKQKDKESRMKANLEIAEQEKMIHFCKAHERYHGGPDCIDCIRKLPTIAQREKTQLELIEKLWNPKTEEEPEE